MSHRPRRGGLVPFIRRLALCASVIAQIVPTHGHGAARSREAVLFGSLPDVSMAQLSPDGRYVSMVVPIKGVPTVAIAEPGTAKQRAVLGVTESGFRIAGCAWAKADRLICLLTYAQMQLRRPTLEYSLSMITPDGEVKELVPHQPYVGLVSRLPADERNIAVALADGLLGYPGIEAIDLYSGKRRRLVAAKPPVTQWLMTDDGSVAAGLGYGDENFERPEIHLWQRDTDDTTEIVPIPSADPFLALVGIDQRNRHIEIITDLGGRQVIAAIPWQGGAAPRVLIEDPDYDVDRFVTLPAFTQRHRGASYERVALTARWLDPDLERLQASLDAAHRGRICTIVGLSDRGERALYTVSSDVTPPELYLLDAATKRTVLLGQEYPGVDPSTLSPMQPVRFRSRDGMELSGYFTRPPAAPAGPLPVVVLPHGGPESRDSLRFDFTVQFLASRGYAVFQPNFRGSAGFGTEFLNAGRQAWGTRMHEDITDGVRWLIGARLADPGRICIAGASYGGYAALLAVAREPDLYRCAASFAGPSDLSDLLFDMDKRTYRKLSRDRIGWDRSALREQSPLRLAPQIKVPVLLVHGDEDIVVELDHSERMSRALEKAGKPHRFIIQKRGDHHLSMEKHRIEFLDVLGSFLDEALRGRD